MWVEPSPCKFLSIPWEGEHTIVRTHQLVAVCSHGFEIVLPLVGRATPGIEGMSGEHGGVTDNPSSQGQAAVPYLLTRSSLLSCPCRTASLHRYKDAR